MRKLLLKFIAFVALIWGLGQISLPSVLVGIGLALTIVAMMHILATPAQRDV